MSRLYRLVDARKYFVGTELGDYNIELQICLCVPNPHKMQVLYQEIYLHDKNCCPLTDEKTEAQKGQETGSRSHTLQVTHLVYNAVCSDACVLRQC